MNSITVQLPPRLQEQIEALVRAGWYTSAEDLACEAIRRFIDARPHDADGIVLMEDVEWGLRGDG